MKDDIFKSADYAARREPSLEEWQDAIESTVQHNIDRLRRGIDLLRNESGVGADATPAECARKLGIPQNTPLHEVCEAEKPTLVGAAAEDRAFTIRAYTDGELAKFYQDAEDTLNAAMSTAMATGLSTISADTDMNVSHVTADLYETGEAERQMLEALRPESASIGWDIVKNRRGYFSLTEEYIKSRPSEAKAIMAQCTIVRAERKWHTNDVVYDALSFLFDEVPKGDASIRYEWRVVRCDKTDKILYVEANKVNP